MIRWANLAAHKFHKLFITGMLVCASYASDSGINLSLTGYFNYNNEERFSLRDNSRQASFWLTKGRERYGIRIIEFNPATKSLHLTQHGVAYKITIEESFGTGHPLVSSISTSPSLSKNNQLLLQNHRRFIKAIRGTDGSLQHNPEAEKAFQDFINTNPSSGSVARYIENNADIIDFEAFTKVPVIVNPPNRDKFNTPGFGNDTLDNEQNT